MDVNYVRQKSINLNVYKANLSENPETNIEVAVPQIEARSSEENATNYQEYNKKDLDDAMNKINNFLKDEHTHAEYSYHKEMKTMMIKIVDEDTKEVILEIPPKKILDMVASMIKQFGLLDKRA